MLIGGMYGGARRSRSSVTRTSSSLLRPSCGVKNEQTLVAMSSLNFRRAPSEKLKPKATETPRLR